MGDASASEYYDRYWETEGWETRPPHKLVELFERYVVPTDACLDVGCGDGGTCGVWLADHVASYVGADVSEAALQIARTRGLDARLIGDASALPFPDGSFDLVVLIEVLEHLFEPQLALAEVRRVLRPGGRVLLTVPNVAHWRNRLDLGLLGRWNPRGDHLSATQPWRDAHVRFFTLRSLTNLAKHSGFDVLARGGYVEKGFTHYLPGLRRLTEPSTARAITRRVVEAHPRLLGGSIYLVGKAGS